MKIILPTSYPIDEKIHYSWRSPIIGTGCISLWVFGIFWLYTNHPDIPVFIFIMNGLFLPIFIYYLFAQIRTRLLHRHDKFLLGFIGDNIIFPIRIPEKDLPEKDNKYLFLNKLEIDNFRILSKRIKNPNYRAGSKVPKTITISYVKITINSKIIPELNETLRAANSAQGYVGSPISINSSTEIHYSITGHRDRTENIKKVFARRYSLRFDS
jgi:hypothetical protein